MNEPKTGFRVTVQADANRTVTLECDASPADRYSFTGRATVPGKGVLYGSGCSALAAVSNAAGSLGAVIEAVEPGQKTHAELQEMLDRAMRACAECIPKELIDCPKCGAPHYDGENGEEFATRPHHRHLCSACGEIFPWGHYSFGVRPCDENGCPKPKGHAGEHSLPLDAVLSYQFDGG